MRTQAIIMIVIASVFGFQAQAAGGNERVTGPAVKNIKAKDRLAHIEKVEVEKVEAVKGPEAKNVKATERLANVEKTNNERPVVLKGPKAKNYKPFRK